VPADGGPSTPPANRRRRCSAGGSAPARARRARLQATSREIFGNIEAESADETTPIDASNPYGIAKAYAHMMVRCYRESYGLFACGGILFNHESPRRSLHFVTRKISAAAACIKNRVTRPPLNEAGEPLVDARGTLRVGLLDAKRDWGYAKEYVEAMWLTPAATRALRHRHAPHTVRFVTGAFRRRPGLEDHVVSDPRFMRPTEIKELTGNYALAKRELGWEPRLAFDDLIRLMVEADLRRFSA
jgi:GDPmannose 4,6-dehydratase